MKIRTFRQPPRRTWLLFFVQKTSSKTKRPREASLPGPNSLSASGSPGTAIRALLLFRNFYRQIHRSCANQLRSRVLARLAKKQKWPRDARSLSQILVGPILRIGTKIRAHNESITADLYIKKHQLVNEFRETKRSLKGHFWAVPAFRDTGPRQVQFGTVPRLSRAFSHEQIPASFLSYSPCLC